MTEEWKDIQGFEGTYMVSNLGKVKSVNYRGSGKEHLLNQYNDKGYWKATLCKNGKAKHYLVHRLVWVAFRGPIPEGYEINHIDENSSNNRLDNLNLLTRAGNNIWGTRLERVGKSLVNHPVFSKEVAQYDLEGNFIKSYPSIAQAERETGDFSASIVNCCKGKQHKTQRGYLWKYLK